VNDGIGGGKPLRTWRRFGPCGSQSSRRLAAVRLGLMIKQFLLTPSGSSVRFYRNQPSMSTRLAAVRVWTAVPAFMFLSDSGTRSRQTPPPSCCPGSSSGLISARPWLAPDR